MGTKHPTNVRPAALAGRFYPDDPEVLRQMVRGFLGSDAAVPTTPVDAWAVMAPHAGLVYSGGVAGQVLSAVEIPEVVVIMCPKHTRLGAHTSLLTSGHWALPGGGLSIDEALANHLMAALPDVVEDPLAHAQEHAIEVILPFLRELRPDVRFVPIAMGYRRFADCQRFGQALGEALATWPQKVLLVSSSDMNHFADLPTTMHKDQLALDRLLALDPAGLFETCETHDISMCGVVPTTAILVALARHNIAQARLIAHTTSAAVSGDEERVVGYAGVTIEV